MPALIALESSLTVPRPQNRLKNHVLTLRDWSQLWVRGGDWLSVVSMATRGYDLLLMSKYLFFQQLQRSHFAWLMVVRIVAQGQDSWFEVLG